MSDIWHEEASECVQEAGYSTKFVQSFEVQGVNKYAIVWLVTHWSEIEEFRMNHSPPQETWQNKGRERGRRAYREEQDTRYPHI
jgi:hypothetical protein